MMAPAATETRSIGVSRLVCSGDTDSFLQEVWARAVRLYPRSLGDEAGGILDLDEFERILGTLNRAHEGWLHFARSGLKPVPGSMVDADGMVDMRKIRAAFAGGETLYLTKAERVSSTLMSICRTVETDLVARGIRLRQPVNAHVFLTPPGSQGFPPHRDEHASFVLQLDGSKEWTIYEPMELEDSDERHRPGGVDPTSLKAAVRHAFRLQAGDVLYMPAWWPHEARASSQHSLHVTVRLFPLRWVDLMSDICSVHPALSGALPHEAHATSERILKGLIRVLNAPGFVEPLPELIEEALLRYAVPRTALPGDGLRQLLMLDQIGPDTLLQRTDGTPCVVFKEGDAVCIRFPGGVIRGPAQVQDVFEHVARTMALRPRDLPPIPGTEYDRLEMAKRMVRDGLMRVADDPADGEVGQRKRVAATGSDGVI